MLLDRHRVAQLIELSALERTVKGPEPVPSYSSKCSIELTYIFPT